MRERGGREKGRRQEGEGREKRGRREGEEGAKETRRGVRRRCAVGCKRGRTEKWKRKRKRHGDGKEGDETMANHPHRTFHDHRKADSVCVKHGPSRYPRERVAVDVAHLRRNRFTIEVCNEVCHEQNNAKEQIELKNNGFVGLYVSVAVC